MSEKLANYIEVTKVLTPLLIFVWMGAWYMVKQLIFKPITELIIEVKSLRVDLVKVEGGLNTRLVVVEQKVIGFEHTLDQHFNRRNQ